MTHRRWHSFDKWLRRRHRGFDVHAEVDRHGNAVLKIKVASYVTFAQIARIERNTNGWRREVAWVVRKMRKLAIGGFARL